MGWTQAPGWLELFRAHQGHEQIRQESDGNEADDDVFHGLELSAGVGVRDANKKKSDRDNDINGV